jgi:hypothetical protein
MWLIHFWLFELHNIFWKAQILQEKHNIKIVIYTLLRNVTLHMLFKVLQSETVYTKDCTLVHALLSFVFESLFVRQQVL